ncbi:MAG: preprotein translocase subunit YajC [Verrucomicrobia bacterium]|nr:MAG: preprotein translocase subunit YajC [Verrucomicrobiota bacterium]TAE86352.1 MAG: preprotein translocase subunit YajC [Verrucomicrobiota bacterium]TAF24362.1 MAG: preprotein translocase subunit YajC [Verrucomicrobiota bacterium]
MTPSLLSVLAQAQPAGSASPLSQPWVMMVLMVVMFYFLLIRPQQRQRKELEKRIASLQKGDEVITTAGIHAIVHHVKERTVVLKVAEATLIEFDKPAVATVVKKEAAAK